MRSMSLALLLLAAAPAMGAPASNSLAWKVTDEKGLFGYIVYRADQREGPFLRISRTIVRKENPTLPSVGSSTYRFEDSAVVSGRTYYYFVDAIGLNGIKQRLSGVQSRTVPPP